MWSKIIFKNAINIVSHEINSIVKPFVAVRFAATNTSQVNTSLSEIAKNEAGSKFDPFSNVQEGQLMFLESLKPPAKRSFNLAAYVNESETLQKLIKLGVSLYDIENVHNNAARQLIQLDFETDCVPYIKFLVDNGLKQKNLGRFLSEYPQIFQEHLDDLNIRINYYVSKGFTKGMIATALNRSSRLIVHKTKTIDHKLGKLQISFSLPARSVRKIVVRHPEVISLPWEQYDLVKFALHEEFGFKSYEMIEILEKQPEILDIIRPVLIERLELVHNVIGFDHGTIARFPQLITGPRIDIKYRAAYLSKLKRNQYDPTKPLYVPPSALYDISDAEFCLKYAKTSLEDYKLFIKDV